jgi:uncharacterized membrane protein YbhN (UPF0104 family)
MARRLIPGLLLGFLVLLALALVGDLRQVSSRMLAFDWRLYPLVLVFTLFNYTLRFAKWHFYLRQLGVRTLPARASARLFVAGFPLAVTPGKVGEALKGLWLQQKTSLPAARGVAVVVAERISDGLAVLALSTLGVIAYPQYWPAFASILALLLGIVIVSQIRPLALALLAFGGRLPWVGRFTHTLGEFYEGSFALFRPGATLAAVGLGAVSWLGEGVGMYLILLGLGVAPGWPAFSIAIFALSFSIVIGAASTLPGGLGASEASIAGILALLLGLSADTAAAATLLIRFATLWFGVSLGLATWVFSRDLLSFRRLDADAADKR